MLQSYVMKIENAQVEISAAQTSFLFSTLQRDLKKCSYMGEFKVNG